MCRQTDLKAGKHGSVGHTRDSKQSSVACRDNHCKAPLSHSQRIKPTGLICRPTECTHTQMPHNTYITHGPLSLAVFYFPLLMHAFPLLHTNTHKYTAHSLPVFLCFFSACFLPALCQMDTCQCAAHLFTLSGDRNIQFSTY